MESWREELYLSHHGIEGQRWGRRNGPPYPLSPAKSRAVRRRAAKDMSDDELRSAINRKRLENRYTSLASQTGKYGKANTGIDIARKSVNVAGSAANTASSAYRLKGYNKLSDIDNMDISKKEKKALKKQLSEYQNEKKLSIASQSTKIASTSLNKAKVQPKTDFSKMSDDELKTAIDRMMLEQDYNQLYGVNKGKDYAMKVLDVAGDVISIGGTALGIALLIKELRK